MKKCKLCNKEFEQYHDRHLYCSEKCRYTFRNNRNYPKLNKCLCGCGRLTSGKYCVGHIVRDFPKIENLGKYARGMKGNKNVNWNGGIRIVKGYKYVYLPGHPNATKQGYVLEHRLNIEKEIKRYLKKDEVVHHIDGNRLNNSIDNLHLCKDLKEHNQHHKLYRNKQGRFISGEVIAYDN